MDSQLPNTPPPPRREDASRQPPDFLRGLGKQPFNRWRGLLVYFLFLLAFLWFWQEASRRLFVRTIPYSQFKTLVAQGQITNAVISEDEITGTLTSRMVK